MGFMNSRVHLEYLFEELKANLLLMLAHLHEADHLSISFLICALSNKRYAHLKNLLCLIHLFYLVAFNLATFNHNS